MWKHVKAWERKDSEVNEITEINNVVVVFEIGSSR